MALNSSVLVFAKTNFADADLSFVNFKCADLRGANFTGADLKGADFTDAQLDGAQFDGAIMDGGPSSKAGTSWTAGLSYLQSIKTNSVGSAGLGDCFYQHLLVDIILNSRTVLAGACDIRG